MEQLVLTQGISKPKLNKLLLEKYVHVIKFEYSWFLKPLYRDNMVSQSRNPQYKLN